MRHAAEMWRKRSFLEKDDNWRKESFTEIRIANGLDINFLHDLESRLSLKKNYALNLMREDGCGVFCASTKELNDQFGRPLDSLNTSVIHKRREVISYNAIIHIIGGHWWHGSRDNKRNSNSFPESEYYIENSVIKTIKHPVMIGFAIFFGRRLEAT